MRVKPVRNCIFVKPDEVVDTTPGGIVLSDYTKKRPCTGVILAMGKLVDKQFSVGQRVLYGEFSGQRLIIDEQEVFLMTEEDILAIEVNHNNNPNL